MDEGERNGQRLPAGERNLRSLVMMVASSKRQWRSAEAVVVPWARDGGAGGWVGE